MFLCDLRRGDIFRIERVTVGGAIGKRLVDMGLNRGVEGMLVRCALVGDPVQIHIRGYNLSLRLAEAAGVEVELIGRQPHFGPGRGRFPFGRGGRHGRRGGPFRRRR